MKLIKPSVELIVQAAGRKGMLKHIEKCGKTCYKSENTITADSAEAFVKRLIDSGHTSVLEHGTVYLKFPIGTIYDVYYYLRVFYSNNPYSEVVIDPEKKQVYVTTNYRVLVENNRLDDYKYSCEPEEPHAKRHTFKVCTNIGVTREANRHRRFSISEQSTRYCNYSKDKFGNELTFTEPAWWDTLKGSEKEDYERMLSHAEDAYMLMLGRGYKPEQAREVLPLATATEAVYTAFEKDWKHFIDLRADGTTGKPHPNIMQIGEKIKTVMGV